MLHQYSTIIDWTPQSVCRIQVIESNGSGLATAAWRSESSVTSATTCTVQYQEFPHYPDGHLYTQAPHQFSEVKLPWVWLVLEWESTWDHQLLWTLGALVKALSFRLKQFAELTSLLRSNGSLQTPSPYIQLFIGRYIFGLQPIAIYVQPQKLPCQPAQSLPRLRT